MVAGESVGLSRVELCVLKGLEGMGQVDVGCEGG